MTAIYEIKSNTLNAEELQKLSDVIDSIPQDEDLIVIKFSLMGADIGEFLPAIKAGKATIRSMISNVHTILKKLEDHSATTVAYVDGFALGGGFELALVCDYRVVSTATSVGLPEVKLGIIPGWGGTVRLPRIIGLENAATWITTGKLWKAEKALQVGAIDAITDKPDFEVFKSMPKRPKLPLTMSIVEREMAYQTIKAQVWPKTKNYPAPRAAVEVMKNTTFMDIDEALSFETASVIEIARSDSAKNMISMFFDDSNFKKKGKSNEEDFSKRVGIVGAGLMGGGIAYQSVSRGNLAVTISDIGREQLRMAVDEAVRLASKRGLELNVLRNLDTCLGYDFSDAGIVIEAVTENEQVKETVLNKICENCPEDTIIASNTSSIPITELAKYVTNPERFIGIHFFSPVHMMPLVEIIRGEQTSDETVEKAKAYVSKIGKTAVVVNDCTSFLVNRCLMAYLYPAVKYRESGALLGVLDNEAKKFGWPMGPFELEKSVGEAVAAKVAAITYEAFPHMTNINVAEHPKVVFQQMMEAFFAEVDKCIEEGIVETREEARMAFIYGTGYPPFKPFKFTKEAEFVPMMM